MEELVIIQEYSTLGRYGVLTLLWYDSKMGEKTFYNYIIVV